MRAAAARRTTVHVLQQPTLLAEELRELRCAVVGVLQKHAEVRVSVNGAAHLIVQVLQPKGGLTFVAVHHVDADHADDLRHRADAMHQGTGVLMLGTGIALANHEGNAVVKMLRTEDVRSIDLRDFDTGALA